MFDNRKKNIIRHLEMMGYEVIDNIDSITVIFRMGKYRSYSVVVSSEGIYADNSIERIVRKINEYLKGFYSDINERN